MAAELTANPVLLYAGDCALHYYVARRALSFS